jgi:cytochrome c2
VVLLLAATVSATFVITKHRIFPYAYLNRAELGMRSMLSAMLPSRYDSSSSGRFASNLFDLSYASIDVPVERVGAGGGLTSVENDLLLLTHEGGMYLVDADNVTRTAISAPPNGFEQYVEFANQTTFEHRFDFFRYNDILYYAEGDEKGLLISLTEWLDESKCYVTTVAQLGLPTTFNSILEVAATMDDWRIVYRTHPCLPLKARFRAIEGHMAGGRLAYYGDSHAILSSGDYSWDGFYAPEIVAQSDNTDYGKILDIDIDAGTARAISKGHRNPQGIYVSPDGAIWSTEQGPRGGDELNRIVEGGNFGWPLETYGTAYNKSPHPTAQHYGRHTQFLPPTYAWVPSVGLSNLTGVNGFHPSWDGDLLAASLAGGSLFRLRLTDDRVVLAEPIRVGERIRYVHQHTDGRIVLWTDSHKILFLSIDTRAPRSVIDDILNIESDLKADERAAVVSAIDQCSECHSFDAIDHERAPGLGSVFGQRIGSTDYRGYSGAMTNVAETWSEARLIRFLEDPQAVVPGTSMPSPAIDDERVRVELVAILKALALGEEFRAAERE